MRLANGDGLRLEKYLRNRINRERNTGILSGFWSFLLNICALITFCTPIDTTCSSRNLSSSGRFFYVVKFYNIRKYSNRPLSHFCKTKMILLFKKSK